ncbi:MAG TPA: PKD domain-containing protein, partial [Chitinophagaceae bacterium]|nr:PKD domain-containing protein [Chitinophagaceae bacterium]
EYVVKLTATDGGTCIFQEISKRIRPSGDEVTAKFGMSVQCETGFVKFTDSSETGSGQVNYKWDFGDGNISNVTNPTHQYNIHKPYTVRLVVSSITGCASDTMDKALDISKPAVDAGPDINVTTLDPIQLNATGATKYEWTPATFLDNPHIGNPKMKAWDPITYVITGTNDGGCSDTDTLNVTVTTSPAIAVPNVFRPGSTRNPTLRPILRQAKGLNYFQVYNRWGQMVFSTKTIGEGWDGTYKGLPQSSGTYVWLLEAIDSDGNIVRKRGSSILVR